MRACAGLLLLATAGMLRAQPPTSPAPERDLSEPLTVAVSEVFYPYSFRDTDGELKGFAVELLDAAARVMHLNLQRVPVVNRDMVEVFRNGRIDLVQFWAETEERRTWADFSVPILRFENIAVVRQGDTRIRRFDDLKGKRVAVGQPGNVGWRYMRAHQPEAILVYTDTAEQFLRMLSAGEIDAAVMSRLTAVSMADRFGLKNLEILDDRIKGTDYDVRYGFAVRKGDTLLLSRLNEGLAILHRTGEFDAIYRKWFGRYEARTFRPVEVVSYVAAALALACIAATWGFLRQRTLSRRIARQAAELAEQRSLLAALHEKHPIATVIIELASDGTRTLVSANSEAIRLFGLEATENLPCALDQLGLKAEWRAYLDAALVRSADATLPAQWEARIPATQQLVETGLVPLGPGESGVKRVCVLSNDVTKRRLLDHEVSQSRRLRALGELVGGIAHEFNNLLTPIILTTSQARLTPTIDSATHANLGVIDKAARRGADLTRRLLTFGRKSDERAAPMQLADVVDSCFALLQPTVDRRIEWGWDIPREIGPVHFNPTDLNQIVFNLVINARDTLLEKLAQHPDLAWTPRLRVSVVELPAAAHVPRGSATAPAAWQRLTVEDNGTGIAPELVDRIFEPFFTTKEVGRGTGLGLATVWRMVTEAGGDVTVASQPGIGTKFHVFLPVTGAGIAAAARPGATAGLQVGAKRCRLLLVEDEPLVAQAAQAILRRHGHTVTHCADGAEAWEHVSGGAAPYDLVLADVNMPRLNGIDLVRRLREANFAAKILMMGGRITDLERRALQELSVDRILAKPFTTEELTRAIEDVLRAGNG